MYVFYSVNFIYPARLFFDPKLRVLGGGSSAKDAYEELTGIKETGQVVGLGKIIGRDSKESTMAASTLISFGLAMRRLERVTSRNNDP